MTRQVRPAYQVEPLKGKVKRKVYTPIREPDVKTEQGVVLQRGKYIGMKETEVLEPAGFMVYFPQGHSQRMTADELTLYGYDRRPPMVDVETGEYVGNEDALTLKDMVEGKTRRRTAINLDELIQDAAE